ncbi:hypothetical protein HMPREF2085_01910 [Fusobacterium nucleatum 13_3C]|jgi:hypothetical protein|uniref:Acyltransferase 3 domain-containing protein n=1 Tax=Fusobacterium nucleatum 13_3C TaxID=1357398 RepID=X7RXB5_FUSNU|nr:acyltransferase family protein [Fusobacterium nucleatum]ETZ25500.1 hypothetical protein HMPREF2085_01910 [Fusobacterium nucleatum 13_3C]
MVKDRNEYLDIVKGIAIILMIFAHCIVSGNGDFFLKKELFWDDILFKIIYSFHMPLFALVSGYLYYFTIEKYSFEKILIKKIKSFLHPIVIFGIYRYLLTRKSLLFNDIALSKVYDFVFFLFDGYWFLWSILFITIIVLFINKFFNDNIKVYIVFFLLTLIIPTRVLSLRIFLYPFFVVGYFFCKHHKMIDGIKRNIIYILGTSLVIFICLLFLYKKNTYIYISGMTIINPILNISSFEQIYIDLFRIIIGFVGSIFTLSIIYEIYYLTKDKKIWRYFSYIGKNSLKFYCFQEILIVFFLKPYTINFQKNYINNFIETVIIILICIFLNKILNKFKKLEKIHFG